MIVPCFANAASISEYYKIEEITKIVVLNYANMDTTKNVISATVLTQRKILITAKDILESLSIDGNVYKDFGKETPTTHVFIMHGKDKYLELIIHGVKIRAPRGKGGSFGLGDREKEFIDLIKQKI